MFPEQDEDLDQMGAVSQRDPRDLAYKEIPEKCQTGLFPRNDWYTTDITGG